MLIFVGYCFQDLTGLDEMGLTLLKMQLSTWKRSMICIQLLPYELFNNWGFFTIKKTEKISLATFLYGFLTFAYMMSEWIQLNSWLNTPKLSNILIQSSSLSTEILPS